METIQFQNLIRTITGREFIINTNDVEIQFEKEYHIYKILPLTGRIVSFYWKSAKKEDNLLKSFITTFCNKYREPDPANYNDSYGYLWFNMTELEKEYAYSHHADNMYNKKQLLEQIQANLASPEICTNMCRFGFYNTCYGIGIFSFYATNGVLEAIKKMTDFLKSKNIPFTNEFSNAKWVFRFVIKLDKDTHESILKSFIQFNS